MNEAEPSDAVRVWFHLIRLETRMRLAISERLRTIGLSTPQCDVLTTLTEKEGVSQQVLAERLYVTKGNISGLIDRLVAAGHVERRSIAADRRQHAIFLTPTGRKLAIEAIAVQHCFVAETIGQLPSDELARLDKLLIASRDLVRANALTRGG
jgi:DNA-binding MarR family transcriptional regulator